MKGNEQEVETVFNALAYFNLEHVEIAKKNVERMIGDFGLNEQRDTALTAFNKYLHNA